MDDNSWRAALAAREPVVEGTTNSGLPRRLPQANLVPGAAADVVAGVMPAIPLGLSRDPQDVRNRLDSFVSGREQARSGAEAPLPLVPPNPMKAPSPLPTAPLSGKPAALAAKPAAKPAASAVKPARKPEPPAAAAFPPVRKTAADKSRKGQSQAPGHPPLDAAGGPADDPWGDGWKTFDPNA